MPPLQPVPPAACTSFMRCLMLRCTSIRHFHSFTWRPCATLRRHPLSTCTSRSPAHYARDPPLPSPPSSLHKLPLISHFQSMQTLLSPSPPSIFFHQHHFNCTRQGIWYRWCFAAAPAPRPCRFRCFFSNRILQQPLQKRCAIQLWHLQKGPWACVHVLLSATTIPDLPT